MDIVCQDDDIADCIDLKLNTKRLYSYIKGLPEREKNDNNHALRSL